MHEEKRENEAFQLEQEQSSTRKALLARIEHLEDEREFYADFCLELLERRNK